MRKHQLLFFADCESLVKKLDGLKNNPKKWSTAKAAEDIASNFFCLRWFYQRHKK